MKKLTILTLMAFIFSMPMCFAASVKNETINQVALLQSLALGYFDGSITVKNLKKLGDTGIGTFDGLNGELIMLDGVVYRANVDCKINVVDDKVTIPFANVTFFDNDFSIKLNDIADKSALESKLNEVVAKYGENSFYMIKLTADFNEILVRSEEGQQKPYPTLVKALETQKEITKKNINGTIVGLYCPQYMSSLNSVGWHFHFVSSDKNFGGHVLQLNIKSGEVQFDKTDNFAMSLPEKDNFHDLNLANDMREDIRRAENDSQD